MRGGWQALATLGGGLASLGGAGYWLLTEQTERTRKALSRPGRVTLNRDGLYLPDGSYEARTAAEIDPADPDGTLVLAILGDSSAAGIGVEDPADLPGVVLARGLAEEADRPVRLRSYAVSGSNSRRLGRQVDDATTGQEHLPHAALIMIGANDVRDRLPPAESARCLGEAVAALRLAGAVVVVGTCPDLGTVRAIPQPLRGLVRTWSIALARMQREAVLRAGGHPVAVADLLTPEFLTQSDVYFSSDQLHPSAAGYEAACSVLLPALCSALGVWGGGALVEGPDRSAFAEARRLRRRTAVRADDSLRRMRNRLQPGLERPA